MQCYAAYLSSQPKREILGIFLSGFELSNCKLSHNSKHSGAGFHVDNIKQDEPLSQPRIQLQAMNQLIASSSLTRILSASLHLINTPTISSLQSCSRPLTSHFFDMWPSLCMSMCLAAAQVSTQWERPSLHHFLNPLTLWSVCRLVIAPTAPKKPNYNILHTLNYILLELLSARLKTN